MSEEPRITLGLDYLYLKVNTLEEESIKQHKLINFLEGHIKRLEKRVETLEEYQVKTIIKSIKKTK